VSARSRHADVTIDSEKPMRLYAVEAEKFVSRDGNTTMQFNQGEMGDEMAADKAGVRSDIQTRALP
jgi:hypothetical protein